MELRPIIISHADRLSACREKIEEAVYLIIQGERPVGFSSTEIAMAIADIADDYILAASKKRVAAH
jgi:phosphate uptake regulator